MFYIPTSVYPDKHQRRVLPDDHGNPVWVPDSCGALAKVSWQGNQDRAGCSDFGDKIRVAD